MRTPLARLAIAPFVTLLLSLNSGCGATYHAPSATTQQSMQATVHGPIMAIDGQSVAPAILGVVSSAPVQVTAGTHQFMFGNYFGQLTIPLKVTAGNSYEFALETYLDSTRLKMRNESTKRTTYFDATKQVYYDESNHFLPTPDTTGFAP